MTFFDYATLVMMNFLGILVGIGVAFLLKGTLFKGRARCYGVPYHRLPGLKNVAQLLWGKGPGFPQACFTVIFLAAIIIWFLQTLISSSMTADRRRHSGLDRQRHRAVVRTGLWRLAGVHGADHRLYGKERRNHRHHPVWLFCRALGAALNTAAAALPAGVLPALRPASPL